MFIEQASTGTFVPDFMVTCCHGKPLLAAPNTQKASLIVKTSKDVRIPELIRGSGSNKQVADRISLPFSTYTVNAAFCWTKLG